ncbi:MAG: hypothetical protein WEB06_12915 [Actinomycetota bacterium]
MSSRTGLGIACGVVLVAVVALWLVGQGVSADPTLRVPSLVERLYPGTWHPMARGMLWLISGAAAVGIDLLIARPIAESRRGEVMVVVLAFVTGACFLAFAIGSFAGAGWSVIH